MRKTIPGELKPNGRIFEQSASIFQKVSQHSAIRPFVISTWSHFFAAAIDRTSEEMTF
jgi:hypothetical protein